jgi:hypothetical protein
MGTTGPANASGGSWCVEWRDAGGHRRIPLAGHLTVGRSKRMDVVIDDPFVSREHCTLDVDDEGVRVDARGSRNQIVMDGNFLDCVVFKRPGTFVIGQTSVQLRPAGTAQDTTLPLSRTTPTLTFRRSTRELFSPDGTLIAQFSAQEAAALSAIAESFPDVADTATISTAVWGEPDYDAVLIYRLMQRVRERMGDFARLVVNVRGAGYRLKGPMDLR